MPARLEISPKDKRDLFRRYARGESPFDLVRSRGDLKLSARQIANLVSREGWAQQRGEFAEERKKSAQEALAQVREDGVRDLEPIMREVAAGMKTDATMLKDGWDLVEDAAGASSLMRAKSLLLSRVLKFHGLDQPADTPASRGAKISIVYADFAETQPAPAAASAVDVTGTVVADEPSEVGDEMNLEFADDEDT